MSLLIYHNPRQSWKATKALLKIVQTSSIITLPLPMMNGSLLSYFILFFL